MLIDGVRYKRRQIRPICLQPRNHRNFDVWLVEKSACSSFDALERDDFFPRFIPSFSIPTSYGTEGQRKFSGMAAGVPGGIEAISVQITDLQIRIELTSIVVCEITNRSAGTSENILCHRVKLGKKRLHARRGARGRWRKCWLPVFFP